MNVKVLLAAILVALSGSAHAACQSASKITYMGINGRINEAWASSTDVHFQNTPIQGTVDPVWNVRDVKNGQTGSFQWIEYLTADGEAFKARWHCEYGDKTVMHGNQIHCKLQHVKMAGGDDHDDDGILYLDGDKKPMLASIPFVNSWPSSPQFCIEPWSPGMHPHH